MVKFHYSGIVVFSSPAFLPYDPEPSTAALYNGIHGFLGVHSRLCEIVNNHEVIKSNEDMVFKGVFSL